ncbi:MAG: hypothetical protein E7294_06125 [Lachnospiraceae bacterium]|nr:hypothetical protein [Lachnospiraceae bacterium]
MKEMIKETSQKGRIGFFLLILLIMACLGDVVNPIAQKLLLPVPVTIQRTDQTAGRNVTILYEEYEHNPDELFLELKEENDAESHAWKYTKGDLGKSWTMLSDTPGSTALTITTKRSPRKYLTLLCNRGGGIVQIQAGEKVITVDCYKDQEKSEICRVYLFEHDRRLILVKIAIYSVVFLLVFVGALILADLFLNKTSMSDFFLAPPKKADIAGCFAILFGIAVYQYKVEGIPNYLKVGDEAGYWKTTLFQNGKLDLDFLAAQFSPRGYWCYVPQTIAKEIGERIGIDPSILWMLMVTFSWSILIMAFFPKLYQRMTQKQARRLQVIPFVIILLTTWRQLLTCVLMDAYGMMAFWFFLYGLFQFLEDKKAVTAVWTGISASVACSFRSAYFVGIIGFVVYALILLWKEKKETHKKAVIGMLAGAAAFVIICLPQLAINLHRDHAGLLAHDNPHAYYDRYVTLWSSDWALANGNIAYPLLATDDQMRTMKNKSYNNETPLSLEQLLDIYMESPVETLMLIAKKLVIGFDQKTNIAHPGDGAVPWRETVGMIFSLWNYFVLFSGMYAFCKNKEIVAKEKWMAGLVFVLTVLPQTFMKIEWRYVMIGYFLIYYFFAFYFVGPLLQERKKRRTLLMQTDYLMKLSIFMFVCLTLSFLFLA